MSKSTKFAELLPATASEKHGAIQWERNPDDAHSSFAGVLTISGKRSFCRYRVEEFGADHGRGFMFFKLDAGTDRTEERYAVLVGRGVRACECRGFLAGGRCKHVAALATLLEAGQV